MMRSIFDSQLQLLDAQIVVMGSSVEAALRGAIDALEARDAKAARTIAEGDDDIDHQEREIESLCLKLLLTQQPVASDLQRVTAALRMVSDLERIGDQAADIAAIVAKMEGEMDAKLAKHLSRLGERACVIVHDAADAFVKRDSAAAQAAIAEDAAINELFERVRADVVKGIQKESDPATTLVDALMLAKYLERIGDHAQNIAEWVEYSVTGRYKGELLG